MTQKRIYYKDKIYMPHLETLKAENNDSVIQEFSS